MASVPLKITNISNSTVTIGGTLLQPGGYATFQTLPSDYSKVRTQVTVEQAAVASSASGTTTPPTVLDLLQASVNVLQAAGVMPAGSTVADYFNLVRGKSAYEVAVANGFVGTETQWLASLGNSDGLPDNLMIVGSGPPLASEGSDGYNYLDINTQLVYGPKANGAWPSTGIPLGSAPIALPLVNFDNTSPWTYDDGSQFTLDAAGTGVKVTVGVSTLLTDALYLFDSGLQFTFDSGQVLAPNS